VIPKKLKGDRHYGSAGKRDSQNRSSTNYSKLCCYCRRYWYCPIGAKRFANAEDKDTGKRKTHSINVSRERLIKKGLIKNRNGFLELTGKGERVLESIENRHYKIKKPRRWDQKWRIIIFDIPTCKNKLRDQTRLTLKAVGFVKLQDSVWVYPYNCEDLINLIKADFKIGKDLLYIVADKIENDLKLRKHFELK